LKDEKNSIQVMNLRRI